MNEIDQSLIDAVMKRDDQNRQALSMLLGELRNRAGHNLALQVRMGKVTSYITSVPLRWVAENVGFAADLPIFKESFEGSKRITVDHETIDTVQQRQPDWTRQRAMTAYLATRRHHKFPPLLLVGYQHWVYEPDDEKWALDGTAMQDSLTIDQLEPTGTYWALNHSHTDFYALDGQHRLMAIFGLKDLIKIGSLPARNQSGEQTRGNPLSRDTLISRLQKSTGDDEHAIHESMQRLMDERIGIEIVPAVLRGEDYVGALRRLRQLFVDVNQNAKKLTSSELSQLDENHGFRIVARKLMGHDLLHSEKDRDEVPVERVDTRNTTLRDNSPSYTTLHALSSIVENYLVESERLPSLSLWRPLVEKVYQRPDDESLDAGTEIMREYLDALARLPSHEAFIQGKPAGELRTDDDNILFRPIAQMALAEAAGKLSREGISLPTIVKVLGDHEKRGQLKLTDQCTPWFGVLCDPAPPHKMRRYKKNERLCCRLFQYLLGGGISDDIDREALRCDFAEQRSIDDELAVDLEGNKVKPDKVRLPSPWR